MKIIQILPELNSGGVERGTLEVGQFLTKKGHESLVISNGGRLVKQLEDEGSRHICLPVHKKSLGSLKQVKALKALLEEEQPDILHLRSRVPGWLSWLAWRKLDPTSRPRLVSTVHGFNSVNFYSKIMTCGETVICVSNSVKDYIIANYPDVPEQKLKVVHRGVDSTPYPCGYQPDSTWRKDWDEAFPDTVNRKLLVLPGRITRLKGHEDFFKILQQLPDSYHGVIAGGAHPKKEAYLSELKARITEMGLQERVSFTGHRSDLREILAIADIVFSLTQQPESFGRTTLEALCLGKPVIGYEHGGVGEILQKMFPQGKVAMGDIHAIVQRILDWQQNPQTPTAENPFTLQSMLQGILNVYENITATK